MPLSRIAMAAAIVLAGATLADKTAFAHGDVTPQPIDASELKQLGKEWLSENPYRGDPKAIAIGASGYNQNCARCHGLEAISGGIAPDLRYLELGKTGDEWFLERIRHGKKNSEGTTIMPAFEGVFSQEAMWAIRAFLESKHEE
ncbi:cytochrome c550 [Hyphomicrobium denitrificans ATCC 51888]|uniref:Cytochrome c550 n=1 Tax=Hyphomicrobium denitrificans (strain ATCC 51888 / DSM 1869 / NCIMB 11706 / TK 0415) TaxID=582899 RepID=D8JRD2_HYPDA|nr:cytochrome c550 [Hyphomicrobium denitrificans ATCC 51888]